MWTVPSCSLRTSAASACTVLHGCSRHGGLSARTAAQEFVLKIKARFQVRAVPACASVAILVWRLEAPSASRRPVGREVRSWVLRAQALASARTGGGLA
jgi:hypothetical protein